ncbi:MAG: glycosyltransferase family 9 protein [Chitinophagaceae bacterium]
MAKLLLIRFSSIGDIVLTSPVIRCLKNQRPDVEIHFLTKANMEKILCYNPHISRLHLLDDNWSAIISQLKYEAFDEVVDLHHNARSFRIKQELGVPAHSYKKLNLEKWLMTALKWDKLPDQSIVDRYLETVTHLGITNDHQGLDYFIPSQDRISPETLPSSHQSGFIGVVIGAAHLTKRLPPEYLKSLCLAIPYPVILLGGKDDQKNGAMIAEGHPQKIFNACGNFTINQSADLIRQSLLIVSHDTGLMHIAAAFQKKIVSIWGNTIPQFGMFPYYGNNHLTRDQAPQLAIVEKRGLSCRPCSKIGYSSCPKGHFHCMKSIPQEEILQAIRKLMG